MIEFKFALLKNRKFQEILKNCSSQPEFVLKIMDISIIYNIKTTEADIITEIDLSGTLNQPTKNLDMLLNGRNNNCFND